MSYAEDILKLRIRFAEALSAGVLDASKETLEAILIQIMNDAEKNRQSCATQAENLRKQISAIDGQAAAFSSVTSIVYNVLNGFIRVGERNKEEEERVKAEAAERDETAAAQAAQAAEVVEVAEEVEAESDESSKTRKASKPKKK